MKIEVDIDDKFVKEYATNLVKNQVADKINRYFNSSEVTVKINEICRAELNKVAIDVVMQDRIKQLMEKKTTEILPETLNDKFIGAYMSVVISEARKQAAEAAKTFKEQIIKGDIPL